MDLAKIRKKARKASGPSRPVDDLAAAATVPQAQPALPSSQSLEPEAADLTSPEETLSVLDFAESMASNRPGTGAEPRSEPPVREITDAIAPVDAPRYLRFMLATEKYAVDIRRIREIIKPKPVTVVPRAPAYIAGIISLRGDMIPVIDAHIRLKLPKAETNDEERVVVMQAGQERVGVQVDKLDGVAMFPASTLGPAPEMIGGIEGKFIESVAKTDVGFIVILNIDQLVAEE